MQERNMFKIESGYLNIVELLVGDEALLQLSDIGFLNSWDALFHSCPWATVYQGKEFVSTWYRVYHKKYLPIIVKAVNRGKLTGLLTLARDKSGLISAAGLGQAEYQVWLATGSDEGKFIKSALLELRKQFPGSDFQFRYIPYETPLEWTETNPLWKKRCALRVYQQPLMIINEVGFSRELKKFNKKMNNLKRLGELKFERIIDSQIFSSIFDELATQFDFRKGAMYNITPFQEDPSRKEFLLALFERNLLHVTILKLNDEIIASNAGTIGKSQVHLQGINTQAPAYARHSPGILNYLMLEKLLAKEGFDILDLTPGGSYKKELATNHVLVYELRVAGSMRFHVKEFRKKFFYSLEKNKEKIFNILAKIGVSSNDLKNGIRKLDIAKERIRRAKQQGLGSSIAELISHIGTAKKYKVYKIEPQEVKHISSIKKNNLRDLLTYQSKGSKLTKWEFLYNAMKRLEKKQHVYTPTGDTCLLNCIWLKEQGYEYTTPGTKQEPILPSGSAILYDIYCHPDGRNSQKEFIKTVVNEVSSTGNANSTYVIVDARDAALCRILEEVGFRDYEAAIAA